jgi:hypothetical protein
LDKIIVDASKGTLSFVGAELTVSDSRLVTKSPIEGEVVPFWMTYYELRVADEVLARPEKKVPYQYNTDPLEAALFGISAEDLVGWTVTKFERV